MNLIEMSPLAWIISVSLLGGALSVLFAAFFALNAHRKWVPMLVSYAIGTLLGAVFLEILPYAFEVAHSALSMTTTVLFGILAFFTLEKLVLWRHCHGDHSDAHAMHNQAHRPFAALTKKNQAVQGVKFRLVNAQPQLAMVQASERSRHDHDHGRSGLMIMIGDTFHNFVDGVLIAAAFMVDIELGLVTAIAIVVHEIPQEIGDFLILLHYGYSKKNALLFNLFSSLAMVFGGSLAYLTLKTVQNWVPYILGLAAASMLYVAIANLIPGLHKRTAMKDTVQQISLILLGVGTIFITKWWIEG